MINPELDTIAQLILERSYQSDEPVRTLAPLKGGEWSAAYKFSLGDSSFVIRLSHTPENFHRDRISAEWSSPALPIPKIIELGSQQNQHYAISPFYPGEAFEMMPVDDLRQTIPGFLSMMTAMQSVNLDSFDGFGTLTPAGKGEFSSWPEALLDVNSDRPDNLNHGWKEALSKTPKAQQQYDQFYKQLTRLVQYCPGQKSLIHSDLLYQNLLVHNHKISAVLDWGCAMFGDPLYDIAMFDFFEPWFPAFTQVNLVQRMKQSFLNQSPHNHKNYSQRTLACQIHLTLGNIAFCAISGGKHDFSGHINRLEEVLAAPMANAVCKA